MKRPVYRVLPGRNVRFSDTIPERMPNVPEFFQKEVLDKSHQKPVLVDFWAEWCGPCRVLSPVLERLARESKGTWRLVKVNADTQAALSQQYGVQGIPAVKLFVEGAVAAEFVGAMPEHAVRRWLNEHLPKKTGV